MSNEYDLSKYVIPDWANYVEVTYLHSLYAHSLRPNLNAEGGLILNVKSKIELIAEEVNLLVGVYEIRR